MARRKQAQKHRGQRRRDPLHGQTIELDIRDMAHGGKGLGMYRGKPVFVPYTLPGESITAEITGGRGKVLFARGTQLKAASADRVAPLCPHFGPGRCWGCQWQHIDYATQLLLKQDVLADQLSRLGKLPDSLIETVLQPVQPASEPWAYNHSLRLLRDGKGNWGLRRMERGIEHISECHVAHPDLIDLLGELDLDYDRAQKMTLRRGSDGQMMLIFEIDAEEDPDLSTDLPLSVNLVLPDREPINLIGDSHSAFAIAGREIRVTAGSYLRGNISGVETLVAKVVDSMALTGEERLLDLYAGVGIFSTFLASQAALITLVESYPPAVNDADVNLSDFDNVDVVDGQVESVLADLSAEEERYDAALVDPPSSGLNEDVIGGLSRLGVGRIVYVSSDPASLARDSKPLFDAGFHLREIQPIDLSPQTYYIDAVARFER